MMLLPHLTDSLLCFLVALRHPSFSIESFHARPGSIWTGVEALHERFNSAVAGLH